MLVVLVPTGACRNSMIAGAPLDWSSLVSTSRMQWPAANRRALGTQWNAVIHGSREAEQPRQCGNAGPARTHGRWSAAR